MSIVMFILAPLVLILAHYKYVDLWFNDRGGLKWFWMTGANTSLMIASKAAFVLAVLFSLAISIYELRLYGSILAAIAFLVHYVTISMVPD